MVAGGQPEARPARRAPKRRPRKRRRKRFDPEGVADANRTATPSGSNIFSRHFRGRRARALAPGFYLRPLRGQIRPEGRPLPLCYLSPAQGATPRGGLAFAADEGGDLGVG